MTDTDIHPKLLALMEKDLVTEEQAEYLHGLLKSDRYIMAIEELRRITSWGLKELKDYLQPIYDELKWIGYRLTCPLGGKWRELINDDYEIDVVVLFDFEELVDNDLESLNDLAHERVLGDGANAMLCDIEYRVAGYREPAIRCLQDSGGVWVRISAVVEPNT